MSQETRTVRTDIDFESPSGYSTLVQVLDNSLVGVLEDKKLHEVVETLGRVLAAVPEDCRDSADFTVEDVGYKTLSLIASVTYRRPATEREINVFLARAEACREAERRSLLKRLRDLGEAD